jgi:hypothetical protein
MIGLFPNVKELEIGCEIMIKSSISDLSHYCFTPDFFDSELFDNIDQISVTGLITDGLAETKTQKFYEKIIQKPSQRCGWGEFGQNSFCKCKHCGTCVHYLCTIHYSCGAEGQIGSTGPSMNHLRQDSYKSYKSNKGSRNLHNKGSMKPKIRNKWTKHCR